MKSLTYSLTAHCCLPQDREKLDLKQVPPIPPWFRKVPALNVALQWVFFLFAIERYAKMREKALCRCFSFRSWPLTQVNSSQIMVVLNARGGPSLAARWAPGQMCLLYEAPRGDG